MKNLIYLVLIVCPIAGIAYSFNYFSNGNLTANEQVLFSIILTIASLLLSWVISHFYYEKSHADNITEIKKDYQSSLKVYASKAAEKVTNLSTEFTKLVNYLTEEFDDNEYESDHENLNAKKERIYSALHIINTLKSINDGSLSDWKGIIPDEIEEIAEEKREEIESLNTILNQYQNVVKSSEEEMGYAFRDDNLKDEIRQLNKKIDLAISNIGGVSAKSKKDSVKKEMVDKNCPVCNSETEYRQKPLPTSRKTIRCKKCNTKLACRWDTENGFSLVIYDEKIHSFKNGGIITPKKILDEAFIGLVKNKLPAQPWPKKIGDQVADELAVSRSDVHKSINILIGRGIFKHQVNGILYVVDPEQTPTV
jgi:hypothetical protein